MMVDRREMLWEYLLPKEEAMILRELHSSSQKNTEFLKVLNIL